MLFEAFYLFVAYSFLGWLLETAYAAAWEKKFLNRGYLNGPCCVIYGITALVLTNLLYELRENWFFLFLGCMIFSTVIEWIAGHFLERLGIGRWWDYSRVPFNVGGYICAPCSALWGVLGAVSILWGNQLLLIPYQMIPETLRLILLLVIFAVMLADAVGSYAVLLKLHHPEKIFAGKNKEQWEQILEVNERIDEATNAFGSSVASYIIRRMARAHSLQPEKKEKKEKTTVFAQGCCFYKLFMLLVVGAFLGDIVETIFVKVTANVWMSRSSLVWGQFSIVWGGAMSMATALLYRYKNRPDGQLFFAGVLLGGAYEYACSVLTERIFGTVFWDYSEFQFNLGGRINLLYCFFWGIAAVFWLKCLYPILSRWIERIPIKIGIPLTWILVVFFTADCIVTCSAMIRYQSRQEGIPAANAAEEYLDLTFSDTWMEERYPNMIVVGN